VLDPVRVIAVSITTTLDQTAGAPNALWTHSGDFGCIPLRCYDVAADGRFLTNDLKDRQFDPMTRMDEILNLTSRLPAR
jgi:hypothetical protein